ncbi:hypothetical protein PALI_a6001 [Pseudoalteromonas aliena SW19]|jgi:hypothetical protein|uniref:Uncharacterized protein n=1 Tax=Pseudoalteromonas aliena SW19 TaxID=1314866 RepID=A0ABR9DUS7_9GAMM|nr:hypothetical protein [Pseudoalteromonas aliena SW19]
MELTVKALHLFEIKKVSGGEEIPMCPDIEAFDE